VLQAIQIFKLTQHLVLCIDSVIRF